MFVMSAAYKVKTIRLKQYCCQSSCPPHSCWARVEDHFLSRRAVNLHRRDDIREELPWTCTVTSGARILLAISVVVLCTVVSELFLEASHSVSDDDPQLWLACGKTRRCSHT